MDTNNTLSTFDFSKQYVAKLMLEVKTSVKSEA